MKYEIIKDSSIVKDGRECKQIRNLETRELGGYVDSPFALEQDGKCWIYPNCYVMEGSSVLQNGQVEGNVTLVFSTLREDASLSGNVMCIHSRISGKTYIEGNSIIESSKLDGNVRVSGLSVFEESILCGNISSNGRIYIGKSAILPYKAKATIKIPYDVVIVQGQVEKPEQLQYLPNVSIDGSKGITIYPSRDNRVLVAYRPSTAKNYKDVKYFDWVVMDKFLAKHNISLSAQDKQVIENGVKKVASETCIKLPDKQQNKLLPMCLDVYNLREAVLEQLEDVIVSYEKLSTKNPEITDKESFADIICNNIKYTGQLDESLTVTRISRGIKIILDGYKIPYKIRHYREVCLNGNTYKLPTVAHLSREIDTDLDGWLCFCYDNQTKEVSVKNYREMRVGMKLDYGVPVSNISLTYLDYVYMQILRVIQQRTQQKVAN